ncbi:MAG: YceI family protein [Leptospira sp.]|nr:YceI family protein [Leptospira sp.]
MNDHIRFYAVKSRIPRKKVIIQLFLLISLIPSSFVYALEIKTEKLKIISGKIKFTSTAPKLEFYGIGKEIEGEIDLKTKTVSFKLRLNSFRTGMKLRDEHMRENYLETSKFPEALFTGKIISFDQKTGEARAEGELLLHGVTKTNFQIKGILETIDNRFRLKAEFPVLLKDFQIEIPRLVFLELNNEIKIEADLELEGIK